MNDAIKATPEARRAAYRPDLASRELPPRLRQEAGLLVGRDVETANA